MGCGGFQPRAEFQGWQGRGVHGRDSFSSNHPAENQTRVSPWFPSTLVTVTLSPTFNPNRMAAEPPFTAISKRLHDPMTATGSLAGTAA
jgi:hypothetical protein